MTMYSIQPVDGGVDDSVVGRCITEPQLSTVCQTAAATASPRIYCGRPPATGFNKLLKSDWGSGGRWFESSHPDQFSKACRSHFRVLGSLFVFRFESSSPERAKRVEGSSRLFFGVAIASSSTRRVFRQ